MKILSKVIGLIFFIPFLFLTGCETVVGNYPESVMTAPVVMPIAQPLPRHHPRWREDSGAPGPHVLSPTRMHWPQNRPTGIHHYHGGYHGF